MRLADGSRALAVYEAAKVTDARLWLFAGFAPAYAVIRWIEAYGLWLEKRWAEWLAVECAAVRV